MKFAFAVLCTLVILSRKSLAEPTNEKFPDDFQFGVATSSYQIEGGWLDDGKGKNIWDHFTSLNPNLIVDNSTGRIACDSYHNYLEDIKMLKQLGVNFYRFSLSWSRIFPHGDTSLVNTFGVAYYKNLISALKENGIEPYVTLYHWDLPQRLEERGGWTSPQVAHSFTDYAQAVFMLFGDDVKNWMTFNEPVLICQYGYGSGELAPGVISDGLSDYQCGHTILKAHAQVYHLYDEEFRPTQKGRISMVLGTTWYEPATDNAPDIEAAERRLQFTLGWFANPLYDPNGNYPQIMIDRISDRSSQEAFFISRLPEFTPEEIEYIKGTFDFFALNTYTTNLAEWIEDYPIGEPSWEADTSVKVYQDPSWNSSASEWLKVVPWGTRSLLNWIKTNYNNPEIVITENGFSDHGQLDDQDRVNFHAEYLTSILEAVKEDGVNVTGYTVWSLMDNFEWLRGYTEKFGLYYVDFDSPNRTRSMKSSAKYYKRVIATKCLVDTCQ